MRESGPFDRRAEVSLDWLVRLRWGAVAGQVATIVLAGVLFRASLPLERLGGLVLALAASNVLLALARRWVEAPRALCGAALAFDALQLTLLLHATGGTANPFSVLYLVYITLAAVVLGARWTWSLAALCVACYGLLFALATPLEHLGHMDPSMRLHLQGMWVAFCVAAALTAYFVVQMSAAIDRRDAEMARIRDRAARSERLASLATLAAGAAHELGTPLATIAVVARELERALRAGSGAKEALLEDAALIRAELDRCRAILDRMAAGVGEGPGEAPASFALADLVADAMAGVPADGRARVVAQADPAVRATALRGALGRVAQTLLRNALDAGRVVRLGARAEGTDLVVEVADDGPGMPPEVLERVGEPFFTTKGPGAGLGLGVFIARSMCEQMGGRLTIESAPGRGTTARARVPCRPAPGPESHA
ncbi:MAG: ATP-binding protein [Vicinamibacteria bacterium]